MKYHFYRFPNKPDILVPYEQLNHRRKELEDYLNNLLNIEIYRRHSETVSIFLLINIFIIKLINLKISREISRPTSSFDYRSIFWIFHTCPLWLT